MKNKSFIVWAVAIVIIIFGAVVFLSQKEAAPPEAKSATGTAASGSFVMTPAFRPGDQAYGNPEAKVVVVEFFDPQCESCKIVHPIAKRLISEYGARVRFVHRYMPFHEHSMWASTALEEAREFGKYDQALDRLFETQEEWGGHGTARPEMIVTELAKLGIPKEKLQQAYLLTKHGVKVMRDRDDGKALGVNATPTFLINGQPLDQVGEEQIRNAIEVALQGQ